MRGKVMIVLFSLLTVASMVYAQEETIDIGDTVETRLTQDSMDYVFEAEEGDFLQISLSSSRFDTLLVVLDESGEEVARDDDSGEDTNSLLSMVVPESGSYTIRVSAYNNSDAAGDFVLRLRQQEITELSFGEEIELEFNGTDAFYYSFIGTAGEAVNISVDSGGELDSFLVLKQNGVEVTRDDDSGEGVDPLIHQYILPADGFYVVELAPLSDRELEGEATIMVEQIELLTLDDNITQSITLDEESTREVFKFTAERRQDYVLNVETDESISLTIEVYVGETQVTSANVAATDFVSFSFTPEESGRASVRVSATFYEEDVDIQVSLRERE